MKAAVLHEVNQPLEIQEVQTSKPGPREVLVRTVAAGICHSDLHFQNGSYPYPLPAILGHESAGVVEEVGSSVNYVKKGDHVITCLSAFCGHCEYCLTGHMSLCQEPELLRKEGEESRLMQNAKPIAQFLNLSSFAEQMLVHEHAITKIRDDMPLDRAALIGCVVNAKDSDAVEAVRELTQGGVHYSFEAIGLKATTEQAFKMIRAGGCATVIGMIPVGTMVGVHGPEFLREKKLQGSNMGSNRFRVDMPRFVDFYLSGKLHLDDMISSHISLEDVNAGLQQLETGEVARNVIMFE